MIEVNADIAASGVVTRVIALNPALVAYIQVAAGGTGTWLYFAAYHVVTVDEAYESVLAKLNAALSPTRGKCT